MMNNYFELLNISEDYDLNEAHLHAAYRDAQLKHHPDRLGQQQYATRLNDAYRTLRDPVKRALYLLDLRGVKADLETDTHLDPDFLAEQLSLRESLQSLAAFPDNQEAVNDFRTQLGQAKERKIQAFLKAYQIKAYQTARHLVRELQFFARLEEQVKDLLC